MGMLETTAIEKVVKKEVSKAFDKFEIKAKPAVEVWMKTKKSKADYYVNFKLDDKKATETQIKFGLKKSLKATVKKGIYKTVQTYVLETKPEIDKKVAKKYFKKRVKKVLKALK